MKIFSGILHNIPKDLRETLEPQHDLLELWNSLTPIARNEWICWITIVKKLETRTEHLKRFQEDIRKGKKRPCCWPGCPHRNPKRQNF